LRLLPVAMTTVCFVALKTMVAGRGPQRLLPTGSLF
jgi:hypothetical protein